MTGLHKLTPLIGAVLLICGAGLFAYGILGFSGHRFVLDETGPYVYSYPEREQLRSAIGAAMLAAGWMLRRKP